MPESTWPPLSDARAELWTPRLSLAGCLRGVMARDTRGVDLAPAQRFNHYPATPLCSLGWWLEGEVEILESGAAPTLAAPRHAVPARFGFSGPQTRPMTTWNRDAAHGLMLLLLPDALQSMTGIEPGAWIDRTVDASQVLPPDWLVLGANVAAAGDDRERVRLIEDFLEPRWRAAQPQRAAGTQRYADWATGLALRAATSRTGRSLRQVERRIRQWAGQPLRELRGFGRAERAFFDTMARAPSPGADWAAVAVDNDYSDQSHLTRATRRITGFPPAALRERIAHDEGFWAYRVWQ